MADAEQPPNQLRIDEVIKALAKKRQSKQKVHPPLTCVLCKAEVDNKQSDGCRNRHCSDPFAAHRTCVAERLRGHYQLAVTCSSCGVGRTYTSTRSRFQELRVVLKMLAVVAALSLMPYYAFSMLRKKPDSEETGLLIKVLFSWFLVALFYAIGWFLALFYRLCCRRPYNFASALVARTETAIVVDDRAVAE